MDYYREWDHLSLEILAKKQLINNQQLTYPDFLDTDAHLRSVVLGVFNRLSEHRNAIVHGSWGQIVNGDLSFDFIVKYNQQHVQETIPFQTVLNMASLCSTVGDLLVDSKLQTQLRIDSLRWLSDQMVNLHGEPLVGVSKPKFLRLKRITTWNNPSPVEIDLQRLRHELKTRQPDIDYVFDLTVQATTPQGEQTWSIPAEEVPNQDTLILNADWDQYKGAIHAPASADDDEQNKAVEDGKHISWRVKIMLGIVAICVLGFLVYFLVFLLAEL